MRLADLLAGLPHGFVGHRAAVDDYPVLLRRRSTRDRVAFGKIEPAAERDGLDGHCSASRSSSPSKTWVAVPRMRIGSPGAQPMVSVPPGIVTLTGEIARLDRIAAIAVAQAPVPQASVRPAPRSHVLSRIPSPTISAILTLIRSGNAASCSILGPSCSI